ncbi:DUF998 domain-containing protein [Streptomyces sp. NPDC058657]|uniref:DUF998 domain-containing protein n=1 Tax=unclassified Streptomyces TaxID=2593676 RepID=UPI00364E0D9D
MDRSARQLLMFAGVLWALGGLWYLLSEAITARAVADYSYLHDYISDLGAMGEAPLGHAPPSPRAGSSPLAPVMNLGFAHQGLLFVLAALCASHAFTPGRGRSVFVWLSLVHGSGLALVALFPSAPPLSDDGTPLPHVIGAAMAILGGNTAVLAASYVLRTCPRAGWIRKSGLTLGSLGVAAAAMLVVNMTTGAPVLLDDGAWERLAVYSFISWQLLVLLAVLTDHPQPPAQ